MKNKTKTLLVNKKNPTSNSGHNLIFLNILTLTISLIYYSYNLDKITM